jgi:hypothetical protein|tara:strand:+ start:765 stop:959 length:195 start_codon:yes stop_codon:yes gene_type:complete
MSNKRGAYNKQVETPEDRQMKYITNLSKSVGEACDRWLAEKGLKGKSWKQQNDEMFNKKKNGNT